MKTSKQLGEELAAARKQLEELFAAHRKDGGYDMPAEKVSEVRKLNDAIGEKAAQFDAAMELERTDAENKSGMERLAAPRRPIQPDALGDAGSAPKQRSIAEILGERQSEIKGIAGGARGTLQFQLTGPEAKTLLTTTDITGQADRQFGITPSAQYLSDVTDLFTPGTTDVGSIEYYEETTFTNAAAETSEGSAAPESALSFTLRTDPVQEISTFLPATRRSLDDQAGLASYINGRLSHMVNTRRSAQLLQGDGIAPNIEGVTARSGIQTQAKAADPTPDAVMKAMTKVRVTGDAEPTGVVFHPNDWQEVRLLRTADGIYIWGSPAEVGPARIWGLDVRSSTSISEGTALVGAFRPFAQIFRREGLSIEISTEHSTFFTERKVAILAYERLALAVYRAAAFCTVTGI